MEIERKWMVTGWPEGLPMAAQLEMEQGYVAVRPTVRIRRESVVGGETHLVLCFKGEGTLSREEIETDIAPELYEKLKKLIGKPMILKTQRRYALPGGLTLEVNLVDEGQPGCRKKAVRPPSALLVGRQRSGSRLSPGLRRRNTALPLL